MGENFTTNVDCGGIKSGTELHASDTLQDTVKSMLVVPPPPANTRYESKSLGTWSSTTDVNNFLSKYNHENDYYVNDSDYLSLGNYVTINDGTYNTQWEIAGFNMEHNQTAADETVYDNGYGICMISKAQLPSNNMTWNNNNTLTGAYMSSTMHTSHLVTVANNLKNVLGNHLVQRNVLLSNSYDENGTHPYYGTEYKGASNGYAWTTSYCTLMSIGQMTGTDFGKRHNKYDDGEANYKLPVFDHENYWKNAYIWTRNVWGNYGGYSAWIVDGAGGFNYGWTHNTRCVRPLIYLR